MSLPKWPKGLKARIAKEERAVKAKAVKVARKREIETAKKKLEGLRKKRRGY